MRRSFSIRQSLTKNVSCEMRPRISSKLIFESYKWDTSNITIPGAADVFCIFEFEYVSFGFDKKVVDSDTSRCRPTAYRDRVMSDC